VRHENHKAAIFTHCDAIPIFEQHWDHNAVITLGDDQGRTLDVKLLELLCFTRTRYKDKVADARKRENDGLSKQMHVGCQSI